MDTILIVEDERDLAALFAEWVGDEYHVRTAHCAEEAMAELDETVDVVLLDRRLPGLPGEEVLERIRDRGYCCRVAMVTAVEPDFDIVGMGFDDYLVKPVTRADLKATVERLLGLDAYAAATREYFSLAVKRAKLRANKDPAELEASEEYAALEERFERSKQRATQHLDAVFESTDEDLAFRQVIDGPGGGDPSSLVTDD